MATIGEAEFARVCDGIAEDRECILKFNPIGSDDEVLLWMLMSCLIHYLSLSDLETPCFPGKPDAGTYREAVLYILHGRKSTDFDPEVHIDRMLSTPVEAAAQPSAK